MGKKRIVLHKSKTATITEELPSLRKRLEGIEGRRLERLREARNNKVIKKMIENSADKEINPKANVLSQQQMQAIYLMCDFVHDYSMDWIAKRIGVDLRTIYVWKNSPAFLRMLDKEITRRKSFMRLNAFRNVHNAIRRGSMKDTWNYLKMSGDLKDQVEVVDPTGEKELGDTELEEQISSLVAQLSKANEPSGN